MEGPPCPLIGEPKKAGTSYRVIVPGTLATTPWRDSLSWKFMLPDVPPVFIALLVVMYALTTRQTAVVWGGYLCDDLWRTV